jgi:hypothetical protein
MMRGSRSLWVGNDPKLTAVRICAPKILVHWVFTQVPFPGEEELVEVMFAVPSVSETFPDTSAGAADCL